MTTLASLKNPGGYARRKLRPLKITRPDDDPEDLDLDAAARIAAFDHDYGEDAAPAPHVSSLARMFRFRVGQSGLRMTKIARALKIAPRRKT